MTKRYKRLVTQVIRYIPRTAPKGGSSRQLTLECGHVVYRKFSEGVPRHVYCRDCSDLADGCYVQIGDIVETWDAATEMPIRTKGVTDETTE